MSKKSHVARHRAVPARINPLVTASRAVTATASVAGKPAAVVVAASGIMIGAALPASAAGEIVPVETVSQQAAAVSTASAGSYTVQAGDTLGSIAAAHGVSLDGLFTANGLGYSSIIYPGQSLSLSGSAAPQQYSVQSASVVAAPQAAPAAPAPAAPYSFQSASIGAPAPGIVGTALQGKGSGYVYGGTSYGAWDCSGFVQWVYAQNGINLPRTTWSQFAALKGTNNPQPGDLVSQNGGSHVGIYLGNGQMISALNPSQGTQVHSVNVMSVDGYYTR
ncbi:NlpC/P60 family protein [Arthrobacter sp. NPDC092385]|uniref:C40 family peptidase n=1 Tax=Arthrobacter sp. NPDC092385 TaxID=3363943 RepID=UPI0037F30D83